MIEEFLRLEEKNDDTFLSEMTFGFKDAESTADCTQRSSMISNNNQNTKKLRKELVELVNQYRHEGYENESL
jgi:hypothetical protein